MTAAPGTLNRPLCPYPKVARWNRTSSPSLALNFDCVKPAGADNRDHDR